MIKNFFVAGLCVGAAIACGMGCTTKTIVVQATGDGGTTNSTPAPDKDKNPGADPDKDKMDAGMDKEPKPDDNKKDAAVEPPVKKDGGSGAKDAGGDPPAGTCAPADVSTFAFVWKEPTGFNQKKCTQAQIDGYFTACLGPAATQATCAPYAMAPNLACAQCIQTDEADPKHGPLVSRGGYVTLNFAGCIAGAEMNTTGTGCGGKVQAVDQCQTAACHDACPVTDDASFTALDKCLADANAGGCAAYVTAAQCQDTLTGPAAACVTGSTFQDVYNTIVPRFCL